MFFIIEILDFISASFYIHLPFESNTVKLQFSNLAPLAFYSVFIIIYYSPRRHVNVNGQF